MILTKIGNRLVNLAQAQIISFYRDKALITYPRTSPEPPTTITFEGEEAKKLRWFLDVFELPLGINNVDSLYKQKEQIEHERDRMKKTLEERSNTEHELDMIEGALAKTKIH